MKEYLAIQSCWNTIVTHREKYNILLRDSGFYYNLHSLKDSHKTAIHSSFERGTLSPHPFMLPARSDRSSLKGESEVHMFQANLTRSVVQKVLFI